MRFLVKLLMALFCVTVVTAQYPTTTPVPILKQINRHNEDGSYSFGYEAADGSYKIESKYPTGEIYGKYGFIDDTGKIREVEYGATKRGFEPTGTGINVPPSTLTRNNINSDPNEPDDDGSYREDPSVYHTDPRFTNGEKYEPVPISRRPAPTPTRPRYQPAYQPNYEPADDRPTSRYVSYQQFEPSQQFQSAPQSQEYQSYRSNPSPNLNSASYSVQYR